MSEEVIGQNINQYRIDKLLGEGGMGRVYLAWDLNLDRQVAIKLMHSPLAVQKEFRERLTQEAKTAASLEHPSIVRVYDFGDSEHGLFIAMEYIGGGTLRHLIRRARNKSNSLQIDQVLQVGVHIAEALDYAHTNNVVHRDVKPGNIILKQLRQAEKPSGAPFRAMLSDFGLVKVSESTLKTQTGFTMGTPIYMSPEQCHGADLDGRSDIYSLGVVLYELATGQPPFAFRSLTEALSTHMKGQMPPLPSSKRSEIPPVLDTVLMRLLAKDPDDRFQTGQQVAEFLRNSAGSLENTPTRALAKISRPLETLDREVTSPPEDFALLLESGENEPARIELNKSVITVGRSGNNDITLPVDGISRFNTRLQATSAGWELIDLGGINGTWLNGERIPPQEGVLLTNGDQFEVGSYRFTIEGPDESEEEDLGEPEREDSGSQSLPQPILTDLDSEPPFEPDSIQILKNSEKEQVPSAAGLSAEDIEEAGREPLRLMLSREKYRIQAGQSITIGLEVFNRSQEMARVNVRVMGLPPEWFKIPVEFTDVPPRTSKSIPVRVFTPKNQETPVGPQRMRVRLISPQFPNLDTAASLTLDLVGYSEFSAGMSPDAIVLPAEVDVTIQNNGNLPGRYAIRLGPYDSKLQIGDPQQPILISPGETVRVPVPLESATLRLTGNRIEDRFNLHVIDLDDESQTRVMGGTVTFRPALPMASGWILGLLLTVGVLSACLLFLFRGSAAIDAFTSRFSVQPTATNFTVLQPSPEIDVSAIAATSAAENATASAAGTEISTTATPPQGLIDTDGDGLSNGQEEALRTSPLEPDTDRDGLKDGDEVLRYGTNPLIQDTDRDTILDGEEVIQFGTDPNNADTDGDGVDDADEIRAGTDPRVPATAVPATPTVAPTNDTTPTVTPIPPTPSQTPVVAPTDTPVVATTVAPTTAPTTAATTVPTEVPTEIPTDIPTDVPTTVPTDVPTDVPTEVPTEVPTDIPTAVPTEIPTVVPTEVATEVPTIEPTAEAAITPTQESPDLITTAATVALACRTEFVPDGIIGAEWNSSLVSSSQSLPGRTSVLDLSMHRDSSNLYIGLRIYGGTIQPQSQVTILIENKSGGDPDAGDLLLVITRAGVLSAQTGLGSNADGAGWAQLTSGAETIVLASNAPEAADWQAELKIPNALANALLGADFLIGVTADLGSETFAFPAGVDFTIPSSQALVSNPTCP